MGLCDVGSREIADSRMAQSSAEDSGVTDPTGAASFAVLRSLYDSLPQPVWIADAHGCIVYSNPAWQQLGLEPPAGAVETWIADTLHADDRAAMAGQWQAASPSGEGFTQLLRFDTHAGTRWHHSQIAPTRGTDGAFCHWLATYHDVHRYMERHMALGDHVRLLRDMLDASADCIKLLSLDGRLLHMNKAGHAALGITLAAHDDEVNWLDLLPANARKAGQRAFKRALAETRSRFFGTRFVSGEGPRFWENILTPMLDETGAPMMVLCVSRDITEARNVEMRLRERTKKDSLTGLANRSDFRRQLKSTLIRAQKAGGKCGLLLLDLDHFKHVNDTLGHAAGDQLLRRLSHRLTHVVGRDGVVARLGGDEFAMIVTSVTEEKAVLEVARRILKRLAAPVFYGGKQINGGVSIGCAKFPRDAQDVGTLLKCADTALNEMKARGRGGIQVFNAEMEQDMVRESDQRSLARQIIHDDVIEPYYQPKVKLDNGHIVGFEALLRWIDDAGTAQPPASVAEAFSDYELATGIAKHMQRRVLSDIARWQALGVPLVPVSINAAPVEFMRDDYAETLLARMAEFNVPPALIEVEITEHMLNERGSSYLARALAVLTRAGLRIALDDFGTGHSSLTHLSDLPVDCLKIDSSFVRRMADEAPILAIIRAVATLGTGLSLDILGEGVESEEQRQRLIAAGCQLGQGFLFGEAMPAPAVEARLLA